MTVDYLKARKQFGKLIGEFQVLQHRAAHLYGEIEIARAAAYKAAELIESTARLCVETQRFPDELVADVVKLRSLFDQTIQLFDQATNPLLSRGGGPGGFGRKSANQGFGRI